MEKEIAVLLPVYNNQSGLDRTINSIQNESELLDIIVVDDGSDKLIDNSSFCKKDNIKIIRLDNNSGIEAALNAGLNYILSKKYKYVARIDSGDESKNQRFKKQLLFMEENQDCSLAGSYCDIVDVNQKFLYSYNTMPTEYNDIASTMHTRNCFCHTSVIIRCASLKDVGVYFSQYPAAEDYELFFRLIKKGYKAANIKESLTQYEIGDPSSISFSRRRRQLISDIDVKLKYFNLRKIQSYIGVFRTLILLSMSYKMELRLIAIKAYLRKLFKR